MPLFTYNCPLASDNTATLLVKAAPDAALALQDCSVALAGRFQPPPYAEVRNLWNTQVNLNSGGNLEQPLVPGLRRGQLAFSFSMHAATPDPDPNHQYTALVGISQESSRMEVTVSLPKWHLDQWHTCVFNFT